MYHMVIGKPGCTWDAFYPNETTVQEDFATGNLFILHREEQPVGAGSIVSENELEDLDFWEYRENARELARIVVAPQAQGKGLGKQLVDGLCLQLKADGYQAVHLLVAKENQHALKLYRSCGFLIKGECYRYEHNYYACEKKL